MDARNEARFAFHSASLTEVDERRRCRPHVCLAPLPILQRCALCCLAPIRGLHVGALKRGCRRLRASTECSADRRTATRGSAATASVVTAARDGGLSTRIACAGAYVHTAPCSLAPLSHRRHSTPHLAMSGAVSPQEPPASKQEAGAAEATTPAGEAEAQQQGEEQQQLQQQQQQYARLQQPHPQPHYGMHPGAWPHPYAQPWGIGPEGMHPGAYPHPHFQPPPHMQGYGGCRSPTRAPRCGGTLLCLSRRESMARCGGSLPSHSEFRQARQRQGSTGIVGFPIPPSHNTPSTLRGLLFDEGISPAPRNWTAKPSTGQAFGGGISDAAPYTYRFVRESVCGFGRAGEGGREGGTRPFFRRCC